VNKKRNVQIFGGTQKYFGGTFGFHGTQVEKHCSNLFIPNLTWPHPTSPHPTSLSLA